MLDASVTNSYAHAVSTAESPLGRLPSRVAVVHWLHQVFNCHEGSGLGAVALAGIVLHHKGVVARGFGGEEGVVDACTQMFGESCGFSVLAFQDAAGVVDVDVVVGFGGGAVVNPVTVNVDMVVMSCDEGFGDAPAGAHGDLGFVEEDGEHGFAHAGIVAFGDAVKVSVDKLRVLGLLCCDDLRGLGADQRRRENQRQHESYP